MNNDDNIHKGHRNKLRSSFLSTPKDLSEKELLELLLTFAIPRKDVSSLASGLIDRFSSIEGILAAPSDVLSTVSGMGESTIILLKVIYMIAIKKNSDMTYQPNLFSPEKNTRSKKKETRVFADDEIASVLIHLPKAAEFENIKLYKKYLEENLQYNSVGTRQRRASYILNRFFPDGSLNTPLHFFISKSKSIDALKQVVFYQLATVEPILKKVAEELIYPALPIGKVTKEQLREFILGNLPGTETTSQSKVFRSIINSYSLLGIGREEDDIIKFQLKAGSLEALVFILSTEFPQPGIFSFDTIFDGPAHRWLLWDKEWIRKQLYILRDMGVLSKVSEIDTVRQISLEFGQQDCLKRFFIALEKQNPAGNKLGDKNL